MARRMEENVEALDQLNAAINRILKRYADDLGDEIDKIATSMGREGAKAINAKAMETFPVKGREPSEKREYEKSWTYQKETTRFETVVTIYSKKPSLAHLLEKGHVSRNGTKRTFGRVDGYPHIAPVAEELERRFEQEVIAKI